ncbi:hypothetical protein CONCODRAFT_7239, partial [Conidiobolus coronatus NRRL 28638]
MKKFRVDDNPISWSTCPDHIITKIGSYINPLITYKIRLINKHWNKCSTKLAFYSNSEMPERKMDYFMERYSRYITFWNNYNLTDYCMLKYLDKISCLEEIEWKILDGNTDAIFSVLERYKTIKTIWLEFAGDAIVDPCKLTEFFSSLINLNKLKELYLCSYFLNINPCLNALPSLNLKQLTLKCDSKYVRAVLNCYKELIQLEEFNLVVANMEYIDSPSREIIPKPSQLLTNNKLKLLKVAIFDSIIDRNLRSNIAKEIARIYSNKYLSKLNYFVFLIIPFENRLPQTIFDIDLSIKLPAPLINLTHLHFTIIDRYFLASIIVNCPNLTELATSSPLVCPYHENLLDLKPLKSLKKILVGGFHMELHSKYCHIKRLFPNVVTLNCFESDLNSLTISRDAGLIPECFPNLTTVIIGSSEYILKRLLKHDISLNWEELYLTIDHTKLYQYQQLITFNLPNLKVLYADNPTINLYKVTKNAKIMLYKAYMYKVVGFNVD